MKIVTDSKEKVGLYAAAKISELIEQYAGQPLLLLLCGGSSFGIYDSIRPEALSSEVTIAMTDDRFDHDVTINNFHQLQATDFYNEAINAQCFVISTEVWAEANPQELAERFEKGLRAWRKEFPEGKVIATFGVGPDGHTGGIMPNTKVAEFTKNFEDTKNWVVGYFAPNTTYCERVTITFPFIRSQIDHAVIYAVGDAKQAALSRLTASEGTLHETPARILLELKDATLFTDQTKI